MMRDQNIILNCLLGHFKDPLALGHRYTITSATCASRYYLDHRTELCCKMLCAKESNQLNAIGYYRFDHL